MTRHHQFANRHYVAGPLPLGGPAAAEDQVSVPVLCYHRFGPTVPDGMTVTTKVFAEQMKWLKDNGYTVIPCGPW